MPTKEKTPTPPGGRKQKRRLKSAENVRRLVADTIRAVEEGNDPGDPNVARVLMYGAQVLASLIQEVSVETRLRALEERDGIGEPVSSH